MAKALQARTEQKQQTRDNIFQKASELFEEKGWDNVTIRDICQHAGVATGTFYLYFKSKQEVLYEVYRKADRLFEEKQISERSDLDTFAQIVEMIRTQYSVGTIFHHTQDTIKQLYIYQLTADNRYFLSEDRKFYQQLIQIVKRGQARGDIRKDMPCRDICWRILRFSRGLLFDWCLHNCAYDLQKEGIAEISIYLEVFFLVPPVVLPQAGD